MSASTASRARIARPRAQRCELRMTQRGGVYRLADDRGVFERAEKSGQPVSMALVARRLG